MKGTVEGNVVLMLLFVTANVNSVFIVINVKVSVICIRETAYSTPLCPTGFQITFLVIAFERTITFALDFSKSLSIINQFFLPCWRQSEMKNYWMLPFTCLVCAFYSTFLTHRHGQSLHPLLETHSYSWYHSF